MMFGQDRNQLRQMYVDAWRKQQAGEPVSPLEALIADIVGLHPEYHALLEKGEDALDQEILPELGESNPFMHMGMHIAIREQLATDRPPASRLHTSNCSAKCRTRMRWNMKSWNALPRPYGRHSVPTVRPMRPPIYAACNS